MGWPDHPIKDFSSSDALTFVLLATTVQPDGGGEGLGQGGRCAGGDWGLDGWGRVVDRWSMWLELMAGVGGRNHFPWAVWFWRLSREAHGNGGIGGWCFDLMLLVNGLRSSFCFRASHGAAKMRREGSLCSHLRDRYMHLQLDYDAPWTTYHIAQRQKQHHHQCFAIKFPRSLPLLRPIKRLFP